MGFGGPKTILSPQPWTFNPATPERSCLEGPLNGYLGIHNSVVHAGIAG